MSIRTLSEEILELVATLKFDCVVTKGEPEPSCDRVLYFVFDEDRQSSKLEELVALKRDYFTGYLSEFYNTDSDKPKKSDSSFLGKTYLVSEKDFVYLIRYFVLDYHNRGPPNSKRPLQYAGILADVFYLF